MKKLLSKIICLILILCVCTSLVACKEEETINPETNVNQLDTFDIRKDATNESQNLMLVDKGLTKYQIVIPENFDRVEMIAADELVLFLKESFGITFKVITDNLASLDVNNYYISVGNTKLIDNQNIERKFDELKQNGYVIANRGNVIYICGYNHSGTLNGVYTFLEHEIGYNAYAVDEIYVDKLTSKEVCNFDTYKYTPNVQFLQLPGGKHKGSALLAARQRLASNVWGCGNIEGSLLQTYTHSLGISLLVNKKSDKTIFPDGEHFCLTNENGWKVLADEICSKIPTLTSSQCVFEIGYNDDVGSCPCDVCKEYYSTHIYSESYLNMLNYVGERIKTFCEENGIKKKIYAMGLMYNLFENPPTTYDEITDTYVPFNENIYVHENVMVRWAPISACNGHAWNDPDCAHNSQIFFPKIEGWASLTDNLSLYTYGIYYHGDNTKMYYPDIPAIKGDADYYAEHPFFIIFCEQPSGDIDGCFRELKDYLKAKMYFDNRYNFDVLFNSFFDQYYKVASSVMKEYYYLIMANFKAISDRKGYNGCIDCWYNMFIYSDTTDWTYETLMGFKKTIDKALKVVEDSDLDAEMKQTLKDRIESDSIMYKHFLLANYTAYYSDVQLEEEIAIYKAQIAKYGISNLAGV